MSKTILILLVIFTMSTAKPALKDSAQFYFVQISDTHWGEGNHLELTKKAVGMITEFPMKIEFIVHTGDLVARTVLDTGSLDSGLTILKSANIPLYFVAGNHDMDPKNPVTFKMYQKSVAPLLYKAHYHGVNIVFACTEPLAASFSIPNYSPISGLATIMSKIKGEPCLLFIHSPPCHDFYNNTFHDTWPKSNKDNFENIVGKYSPDAIIAGHFHRSDIYWIKDCPVYVCPPIAGYFGREASFRLYEYRHGRLEIISQYVH